MKKKIQQFVAFIGYLWLVYAVLWTIQCGSDWLLERGYHFAAVVYVIGCFGVVIMSLVEILG
jgi:hypothetical protein